MVYAPPAMRAANHFEERPVCISICFMPLEVRGNALPPHQFSLAVEMTGSKKRVLDHLQLIPGQANAVNVQLRGVL